jgi:hypothetical protein
MVKQPTLSSAIRVSAQCRPVDLEGRSLSERSKDLGQKGRQTLAFIEKNMERMCREVFSPQDGG